MMVITYIAFCILGVTCVGLQFLAQRKRREPAAGNNPHLKEFQKSYFFSYLPALFADWLQGPYLYKLYSHYGFEEDQIAVLYVCGFASTVILGTWAPVAADRFGRKKLCIFFTCIYTVSCFMKLSRSYGVLILARLFSGMATSLLFSAFEAWYVHEHTETYDFPKEWIGVTFNQVAVVNGLLAIGAGIVANVVAEWLSLGPVAPFMLAIPCLLASGIYIIINWKENYGSKKSTLQKACSSATKSITSDPKIFLIGCIQSLFESVMYIFVFIWTPILQPANPSLGITFSSFMVCIMIGSAVYQLLLSVQKIQVVNILLYSIITAFVSCFLCIIATNPNSVAYSLAFLAFLVFEIAAGIYFPAMSKLNADVLPETSRRSITNIFRLPLNLIACGVLMMLHNDTFRHGNRLIFATCAGITALACLLCWKLMIFVRQDLEKSREALHNSDSLNSVNHIDD